MILAEIETSAEKVKGLETQLTAEKEHAKGLVEQYRTLSGDALKLLGIETPRKERRPKSNEKVLMGAAIRRIRQLVKSGEKNAKIILAAATDAAEAAKTKLSLSELPAEVKQKIDEKVKGLGKAKTA
jgi:hypothetical protein